MHVIVFEKVGVDRPTHERLAYASVAPDRQLAFHLDHPPTAWDLEKYSELFIESIELTGKELSSVWLEDGDEARYMFNDGGPGNLWTRHTMQVDKAPEVN